MTSRLYSAEDVAARIDYEDALETVERTYRETARGRVLNPPKLTMHMGDDGEWPELNAFSIDMPAYVDWLNVAGTKWAVATWDETDGPISSLILLFDMPSNQFKLVMEGMQLTGIRTALQTVVGLKHLPSARPVTVGVIGAGFQAEFQISVIDRLLDVPTIRLFDVDEERAHDLADALDADLDADLVVTETARDAAASDAVVTVTDSKSPVVEDRWLDETELVVALGSYRELSDETIRNASGIVVDHVDQCLQRGALSDLAERGSVMAEDIDGTIGQVLNSDLDVSARGDAPLVFVPIGLGSLDVALAERVYAAQAPDESVCTFDFE